MPPTEESEDILPKPKTARRYEPYSGPPPPPPSPPPKQTLWKRVISWLKNLCSCITRKKDDGSRSGSRGSKSRTGNTTPTRPNKLQKPPPSSFRRALTRREQQAIGEASRALPPPQQDAPHALELAAINRHPLSRKASKRSSIFGLTSFLDHFAFDVERTFLTPVEKTILARMQQVTGGGKRIRPLVPGEPEILLMPDRDSAEAVAAVRRLTRYLPEEEKGLVERDLERLLTGEQRGVLGRVLWEGGSVEIRCVGVASRCRTPESVGQEQGYGHEQALRESPAKSVTFGQSPRAASVGGVLDHHPADPTDIVDGGGTVRHDSGGVKRGSCLRGGGDNAGTGPRRPTFDLSNLIRDPGRLEDSERPPVVLWWLAGGCIRRDMPTTLGVPTAATLRERRRVETENRDLVGFWGTVAGVRAVKKTRRQLAEVCQRISATAGAEAKAGSAAAAAAEAAEEPKEKERVDPKTGAEGVHQVAGQAGEQEAGDATIAGKDAQQGEGGKEEAAEEGGGAEGTGEKD
ncbi:hypothetical protein LTR36_002143 [Oleoguttula mirabilis]|uniref:Uncharacterized protein n=1 Tax=Oleoguttula mirabilis TaxID=1507867 RepID=A0AAV9JLT8_9PEZI|nr:hypothetical protein LTR36_002143 [Oleoguttula mirabilis]